MTTGMEAIDELDLRESLRYHQRLELVGREDASRDTAFAEHHRQVANLIAAELKRRGLDP